MCWWANLKVLSKAKGSPYFYKSWFKNYVTLMGRLACRRQVTCSSSSRCLVRACSTSQPEAVDPVPKPVPLAQYSCCSSVVPPPWQLDICGCQHRHRHEIMYRVRRMGPGWGFLTTSFILYFGYFPSMFSRKVAASVLKLWLCNNTKAAFDWYVKFNTAHWQLLERIKDTVGMFSVLE